MKIPAFGFVLFCHKIIYYKKTELYTKKNMYSRSSSSSYLSSQKINKSDLIRFENTCLLNGIPNVQITRVMNNNSLTNSVVTECTFLPQNKHALMKIKFAHQNENLDNSAEVESIMYAYLKEHVSEFTPHLENIFQSGVCSGMLTQNFADNQFAREIREQILRLSLTSKKEKNSTINLTRVM